MRDWEIGTLIPNTLCLIHERDNLYSLQTTEPVELHVLNRRMTRFLKEKAERMDVDAFCQRYPEGSGPTTRLGPTYWELSISSKINSAPKISGVNDENTCTEDMLETPKDEDLEIPEEEPLREGKTRGE
ncbi:hypothetical protein DFH27DRAFT_572933 [Peziza echinospora]|nr:hypothetical protein DFH27DRAFT_572933 [Peziza echinospora]